MKQEANQFLIDKSELLKPSQKATAWGITLIFWGAFLYLLQPLLSLIAWWLNIRVFYNQMILLGGYQAFIEALVFYLTVIAILGGGLILWGLVNMWRFKGKDSRAASKLASVDDIAKDFDLNVTQLKKHQLSKRAIIKFSQDGKVIDISE